MVPAACPVGRASNNCPLNFRICSRCSGPGLDKVSREPSAPLVVRMDTSATSGMACSAPSAALITRCVSYGLVFRSSSTSTNAGASAASMLVASFSTVPAGGRCRQWSAARTPSGREASHHDEPARLTVFEHLEIGGGQVRHAAAALAGDHGDDLDQGDFGTEGELFRRRLLSTGDCDDANRRQTRSARAATS